MKYIKNFEVNGIEYNEGEYVYANIFGGKMCKVLDRAFTHTNIEYYNDHLDKFEHFRIYQSDIERKLTESEIEEYLDFKKEFELRKEGEIYNL